MVEKASLGLVEHVGGYWLKKGDRYFCHLPPSRETIAYEKYCGVVECVTDRQVEEALREWEKARDAFLRG